MSRIEACRECGRPFHIPQSQGGPGQDYEDIKCPHCKAVWGSERTSGVFATKPLSLEEERNYKGPRQ